MSIRRNIKERVIRHRSSILLVLFLIIILTISLGVVYYALLENSQDMGKQIAYNYSVEEERSFEVCKNLVKLGVQYIDDLEEQGDDNQKIHNWIQDYFEKVKAVTGKDTGNPYVVRKGKVIAATPWKEIEDYKPEEQEWYQQAVAADGEVICTGVYKNSVVYEDSEHEQVVTIAQKSIKYDNVIAFDIYPENFRAHINTQDLPDRSSYFVCDADGVMLYGESSMHVPKTELPGYVDFLYKKIKNEKLEDFDDYVYDLEGNKRAAYYHRSSNGWYCIITVPYNTLLRHFRQIFWIYAIIFSTLAVVIIVIRLRKQAVDKIARRTAETIQVLGNFYYALYRIDIDSGKYEIIKGSLHTRPHLKPKGDYKDFIKNIHKLMSEETYNEFIESFSLDSIRHHLEQGRKEFGGDFLRSFDGKEKWVNVLMLSDSSLKKNEVILCFRNIDEEKQHQLQHIKLLEAALEETRKSKNSQRQFFSEMSHDMRTPLNGIIGISELAKKNVHDSDKTLEYLKKIDFSSKQLLGLINDILNMSKMEQMIALDNSQFDFRKNVRECIRGFQRQAEKEEKEFLFRCDIKDSVVIGDSIKINQIFNNLLSNALKFTRAGDRITVEINQRENKECTCYQIVVADTGIGMSKEFQKKIFIPYEREHRFGAKNIAGIGLGLPIVQRIVSYMGGDISVESEPGKGSIFTVMLPMETVKADELVSEGDEKQDIAGYSLEQKNILLAEDYELNMEIATELLEMRGARIVQAWNGKEALEQFEKSEEFFFDAILMDMQMPVMNGCEAASAIRALDRKDAKEIPIIAVTANVFAEDIVQTAEAGMDAHIAKPIQVEILCDTLKQLMLERKNLN